MRLLRQYWDHLGMVARESGYCVSPFKRYSGVTKGKPIMPKLFDVVVGAVVRHYMTILKGEATDLEVFEHKF